MSQSDAAHEAVLFAVRQYRERAERSPGLSCAPFSLDGWRVIEAALRAAPPTTNNAEAQGAYEKTVNYAVTLLEVHGNYDTCLKYLRGVQEKFK